MIASNMVNTAKQVKVELQSLQIIEGKGQSRNLFHHMFDELTLSQILMDVFFFC